MISRPDGRKADVFGQTMRNLPQQERSRRRYAAIVDAAAELFATSGYDATTMEAIAAASGSAIGSVYRFFPNKQAVFRAVADLALERAQAVFIEIMSVAASGRLDWGEVLDQALDAFAKFHDSEPAPRAVFANLQLYGEYAEADQQMIREFIAATAGVVAAWAPKVDPETRQIVATMIVQTMSGILVLSHRESPAMAAAMLAHTKLMLRRYLEPWMRS
jgi:AcrR family transcriptional regulator